MKLNFYMHITVGKWIKISWYFGLYLEVDFLTTLVNNFPLFKHAPSLLCTSLYSSLCWQQNDSEWQLAVWQNSNVVHRINEVTLLLDRLVLGWVTIRMGIPSRYVISQLGQLSFVPRCGH